MSKIWQSLSADELAQEYSPSSVLPKGDLMPFIQRYIDDSTAAYAALPQTKTLRYGTKPSNTIDLVMPETGTPAPLLVFFHGGYWQELSKREGFFAAPDALGQGIGFASVDYTLAPAASMDEIVGECRQAVDYLFKNATALGIDSTRIVIAGSSAGAHLAAMYALASPRPAIAGLMLLSGIYDLTPLVDTYVNDALGMSLATATRNSPTGYNLAKFPTTVIAWGDNETSEFKRQSRDVADQLASAKVKTTKHQAAHRNHFDIVHDLINDSALGKMTNKLFRP